MNVSICKVNPSDDLVSVREHIRPLQPGHQDDGQHINITSLEKTKENIISRYVSIGISIRAQWSIAKFFRPTIVTGCVNLNRSAFGWNSSASLPLTSFIGCRLK